jgi:hypothetical protein
VRPTPPRPTPSPSKAPERTRKHEYVAAAVAAWGMPMTDPAFAVKVRSQAEAMDIKDLGAIDHNDSVWDRMTKALATRESNASV